MMKMKMKGRRGCDGGRGGGRVRERRGGRGRGGREGWYEEEEEEGREKDGGEVEGVK